jgi:hypothetical protein
MGKNASKNFVNQFKNTRRLAGRQAAVPLVGQAGSRPLVGQACKKQKYLFKGQAGGHPIGGPARPLKKIFPGKPRDDKNPDRGDK